MDKQLAKAAAVPGASIAYLENLRSGTYRTQLTIGPVIEVQGHESVWLIPHPFPWADR